MIRSLKKKAKIFLFRTNFRRYLLYAIGEIILVVIGILIALQINSWQNQRMNRKLEKNYLMRLVQDLQKDTATINLVIYLAELKKDELEYTANIFRAGIIPESDTIRFLESCIHGSSLGWGHPKMTEMTIEDLQSTGNMRIIRDAELRTQIATYYRRAAEEMDRIDSRRGSYPQLSYELLPRMSDNTGDEFQLRKDLVSPKDLVDRIEHSDMEYLIVSELNLANFIKTRYELLENFAIELLGKLESKLQNFN